MKKKEEKTNVMRMLDQKKIPYKSHCYIGTGALNGTEVADALGQDRNQVFKTLVTVSPTKNYYVFMIPVEKELDLKKAAKAVGEKSISMIRQKELLPLTGYVHGGCSPIGMKKQFRTVVDITCNNFTTIIFSAGKIGYQVELSPEDLKKAVEYIAEDIKA